MYLSENKKYLNIKSQKYGVVPTVRLIIVILISRELHRSPLHSRAIYNFVSNYRIIWLSLICKKKSKDV